MDFFSKQVSDSLQGLQTVAFIKGFNKICDLRF